MKITFLGTGTSNGVPVLGCQCDVCASTDPHDKRLRCSALVETETTRLLIDCGPDFRQQMMSRPFRKIDGLLVTHTHYDHVGGIDDVRPYCSFGFIDIYAEPRAIRSLKHNMPYCFAKHRYPGVPGLNVVPVAPHKPFNVGDITVVPVRVMHGTLPILGFRIGPLAYITDMKTIDMASEGPYLQGIDTLVVNALRFDREHHSHQLVDDAIAFASALKPRRTLLIHSCHNIGRHNDVNDRLPDGVTMAYDGQVITL